MSFDFNIDIQNPETLSDYILDNELEQLCSINNLICNEEAYTNAEREDGLQQYWTVVQGFENLNLKNTYKIGDASIKQKEECNPKDCDCIKYPVKRGHTYFDQGMGYNCVGYALCRLTGINVTHYIELDNLKKSVVTTLDEFNNCTVDNCKDEIVPDNILEVPFDRNNPSFESGALLFFGIKKLASLEYKCTHIAKCFSKVQIQIDGQLKELENYCISKLGTWISILHYYSDLEGKEYGRIYDKMLLISKEKKREL